MPQITSEARASQSTTTFKILVAEDDPIISADIKMKLVKMGHEVVGVVRYGERVEDSVLENKPDMVLMDISLKGEMSGLDAAEIIYQRYKTPIIFLTAYSDLKTTSRAKLAMPYGFLKKPINYETLRLTLEMGLNKAELDKAKATISTLHSLLPICASCKKIRDDTGCWEQIEQYISSRSDIEFTHGICPECTTKLYGEELWLTQSEDQEEND